MTAIRSILEAKDRTLYTVHAGDTVLRAVETMCIHHIGAILVESDGALRGVLTERDVMIRVVLAKRDPATTTVAKVMTRDLVSVAPDADHEDAIVLMTEQHVRHLPVVELGSVVGVVSLGDLVRCASECRDYEIRTIKEYVAGAYS